MAGRLVDMLLWHHPEQWLSPGATAQSCPRTCGWSETCKSPSSRIWITAKTFTFNPLQSILIIADKSGTFFFKFVYLFVEGDGTERGRERENPKHAPYCQLRAQPGAQTREP